MHEEYWQQRWQFNEIGFNQSQPNVLMQRYFPELDLNTGNRVFVPLCGKSIDMTWLACQGYKVVGVELNEQACKAFFNENKIRFKRTEMADFTVYQSDEITLFSGDFFKLNKNLLDKVDAVYDRAALIALPELLRSRYSEHMAKLLEPETKMLLITTSYNQNEMQGPPFSVDEMEIDELFKTNFDITQIYNKAIKAIPEHLSAKGLKHAIEQVYFLVKKKPKQGAL
ncbi:thiopurine S-methyltransferase [Legionella londiniensis]|uniref:Thiopurine S-methyltransferase n=1 Tax=Legionella londiniensis TaxID=45068 RepID=A0A0W0VM64_9GAMM|nr:thiopurine S-methyltransferase [Legionella londiniensis]KTD21243.1 thiopurine S-methyltransferase [Legionella londiniensis]STX93269.1 thiopurine S-methyltransferase [Legionella londiniensis]